MSTTPKYPNVTVQLTGQDGNPFFIIGRVRKALLEKVGEDAAEAYTDAATSGDYDNVLATTAEYVSVT